MSSTPATRIIDCADCSMFESDHCSDCVVTYLCDPVRKVSGPLQLTSDLSTTTVVSGSSTTAVVFDLDELRAVKLLADAGLVPKLRHSAAG